MRRWRPRWGGACTRLASPRRSSRSAASGPSPVIPGRATLGDSCPWNAPTASPAEPAVSPGWLHAVAEFDQRVPDPGLGRADGDAQDAGDLGIGVPAVEGQQDGLPLQLT